METHVIAWISAAISVAFATILSTYLIYKHLAHYDEPELQRNIVRILILVPVYGIDSLLSLIFYHQALYFDLVRDCYEAYVLYCFFALLMNFLEGEENLIEILERKPPMAHPFPCSCIYFKPGSAFLKKCRRCILQFVIIKPTLVIVSLILDGAGYFHEGEIDWSYGYPWILLIDNCSITLSLYYLVLFYMCTHDELASFQPTLKFICIKAIIFFSFWQGVLIAVMAYEGFFESTEDWTEDQIATGLQDYIICIEITPIACAFAYAFGWPHYKDGENAMGLIRTMKEDVKSAHHVHKIHHKIKPVIKNFTDVADVTDVLDDTIESFKVVPKKTIVALERFWELPDNQRHQKILKEGWLLSRGLILKKWKRRYVILINDPPGLIYFDDVPYKTGVTTSFSIASPDLVPLEQASSPQEEQEEKKQGGILLGMSPYTAIAQESSKMQETPGEWKRNTLRGFVDFQHVVEIVEEEGVNLRVAVLKVQAHTRAWWFQSEATEAPEWMRLSRELLHAILQQRNSQILGHQISTPTTTTTTTPTTTGSATESPQLIVPRHVDSRDDLSFSASEPRLPKETGIELESVDSDSNL